MRIAVSDVGGTAIKSGLWDGEKLSGLSERNTFARKGGPFVVERITSMLEEYLPFDAVGISTAGFVDPYEGSIFYANDNIPDYTGTALKSILQDKFGVPVAVENDGKAAAWGEMNYGAARGRKNFLCLTYGTGIGGAIVMDGKIYRGESFMAGSLGQILTGERDKTSGRRLCYEECASVSALVRSAQSVDPALDNGRKVFAASHDPGIGHIIDRWIDEITAGLVTLSFIFDPECIILGGGVMENEHLIPQIRKRLDVKLPAQMKKVPLLRAQLGNRAGMMGAAALAQSLL